MSAGQHDRDRGRRAQPPGLEAELVEQDRRRGRRITRAAARGHPDEVEVAEGEDDRQRQRHHELVAQAGQRDREELAHRARAVDAGRVVQVERDPLDPRDEEDHAEAALSQVPTRPMAGSARSKSPSQERVSSPEADQAQEPR